MLKDLQQTPYVYWNNFIECKKKIYKNVVQTEFSYSHIALLF